MLPATSLIEKPLIINVQDLSLEIENMLILKNISFQVKKQETIAFMGKNGSGKSILFKTFMGLLQPTSGSSFIFNQNIYNLKRHEREDLFSKIGYVFQKSGLFDSMTIEENVIFAVKRFNNYPEKELSSMATRCLNQSGLKDVENKLPSELSGGMQKRASIARAIAHNPSLLILDDPVAGLDPVLTDAIADLLITLRKKLKSTVILATHDLHFAYKLADKIALIVNGSLHGILDVEDFKTTEEPTFYQFREGLLSGPIPVVE